FTHCYPLIDSSTFTCVFFNYTATPEIYTLSLHDALPIFALLPYAGRNDWPTPFTSLGVCVASHAKLEGGSTEIRHQRKPGARARSEEHTSELQSLTNLVCRLLLDKKKITTLHTK